MLYPCGNDLRNILNAERIQTGEAARVPNVICLFCSRSDAASYCTSHLDEFPWSQPYTYCLIKMGEKPLQSLGNVYVVPICYCTDNMYGERYTVIVIVTQLFIAKS